MQDRTIGAALNIDQLCWGDEVAQELGDPVRILRDGDKCQILAALLRMSHKASSEDSGSMPPDYKQGIRGQNQGIYEGAGVG